MLGVLAIIGVLSVGGIAGYSKAMNKFKTNQVADQVSMLIANIKTMYAQQSSYEGLNNVTAVDMGLVPDELGTTAGRGEAGTGTNKHATQELTNSFNGQVYISATTSVKGKNDNLAFYIIYTGLSKEACITLATNDWGSGYSSGLIAMQVQGVSVANTAKTGKSALGGVMIGENSKAVGGIAMPAATGTNKGDADDGSKDVAQNTVPMPVAAAAKACACSTGNTCSISWKYY